MKEHRIIVGDLQTKDTYIRDHQKKIRELEAELVDFVHAYDVSLCIWQVPVMLQCMCLF